MPFMPRTISIFSVAMFFIATYPAQAVNIGYQILADRCTEKSVVVLGRTGGDSLSFLTNNSIFCTQMPRTTKNCSDAKYSNVNTRATCESGMSNATLALQVSNPYGIVCFTDLSTEMQKYFDVEMNAKNKAYSYITSKGLLNDFAAWSRENRSDDWHNTCLKQLELLVTNEN